MNFFGWLGSPDDNRPTALQTQEPSHRGEQLGDYYYMEKHTKNNRKVSDGRLGPLDRELEIPEERTIIEIQTLSSKKSSLTNLELRNPNNPQYSSRPQGVKGIKPMRNMGNGSEDYSLSSPGSPSESQFSGPRSAYEGPAKRKTSSDVGCDFPGDRGGDHCDGARERRSSKRARRH
jgi:hypothetical protein